MTKPALPPISDEIREATKPRLDVRMAPRGEMPDAAVEERARSIGERWGAATHLVSPSEPPKPQAPLTSVRFDAPAYLDRELAMRAAAEGVTKTYLILQALAGAGFRIEAEDLVPDRRRLRK